MTIADYTTLQAAVSDWANRMDSSVTGRVKDFIRLGEDRIWRANPAGVVRSQFDVKNVPLVIPAGQNWVALPADWLEFERITLPNSAPPTNEVTYMSADMLEDLQSPGNPNVYSIEGGNLLYGAPVSASGANQTLNCRYHAHPGTLDAAPGGTTWLLQKVPSIYLYAALVEVAIYVKKSDKIAEYGTLLDQAIAGFMSTERASKVSGGRLRYRRA